MYLKAAWLFFLLTFVSGATYLVRASNDGPSTSYWLGIVWATVISFALTDEINDIAKIKKEAAKNRVQN